MSFAHQKTEVTAQELLGWFRGNRDVHAQAQPGHHFVPVHRPATTRVITSHLEGRYCAGFYLMDKDNTVRCACLDIDNHDGENPHWEEDLAHVAEVLSATSWHPTYELSQSGEGAHVWVFPEKPVPAWWIRNRLGKLIAGMDRKPEIYPKQDTVREGGLGNLMRFPLWNKSRFIDPRTLLDAPFKPEYSMVPHEFVKPKEALPAAGNQPFVQHMLKTNPNSLLSRRWKGDDSGLGDRSRSAIALSIACELVWYRVSTEEIKASLREWCAEMGYAKGKRQDWIDTTVEKAYRLYREREDLRPRNMTVKDAALKYMSEGKPVLYGSGIKQLDDSIGGVSPGELLLLAARPSNAKSALGVQWAHQTAKDHGPTLVLSAEMSYREIGRRATLGVKRDRLLAELEIKERYASMNPIYLEDDCPSIESVVKLLEQHVRHHGIKMAFVDYAQLLQTREGGSRYEKVTHISQELKAAAKAFDVALVVAAQMSREVEKRMQAGETWDPTGADLKESGQLEQDADKVLFLAWPVMTVRDSPPNLYKIKVFKNRNGEIKQRFIDCKFYPDLQTFE